jgi:6-phosphogluconolactonase
MEQVSSRKGEQEITTARLTCGQLLNCSNINVFKTRMLLMKTRKLLLNLICLTLFSFLIPSTSFAQDNLVFFGTHSVGSQKGISVAHFNSKTGILTKPKLVAESPAPAYFILHPNGKFLYTCNSNDFSKKCTGETITAYSINKKTGKLTLINKQSSGGADPSYIFMDAECKHVLVADYAGGSIAVIAINSDGSLGKITANIQHTGKSIDPKRQTKPYAHSIQLDPTNSFALAADLGVDKLFVYKYNKNTGTLTPNDPPFAQITAGAGPRHFAFHPNRRFVYLLTEMGNTVITYAWDGAKGILSELQTSSTLPADFNGNSNCAEILVHPNGKFLYASNRGDDSIAVFAIDSSTGKISLVEHIPTQGNSPRNFEFDPTGKWLIVTNHKSNNAVVFSVNEETGHLTPNGQKQDIDSPFCVRFLRVQ